MWARQDCDVPVLESLSDWGIFCRSGNVVVDAWPKCARARAGLHERLRARVRLGLCPCVCVSARVLVIVCRCVFACLRV